MDELPIEETKVKVSYCDSCKGTIRVAILHTMDRDDKKRFYREAWRCDANIKTQMLLEYKKEKSQFLQL